LLKGSLRSKGKVKVELLKRVEAIIEEPLAARGYTLVRVQLSGGVRRKVLQVMIERLDELAITVDDCTAVSRIVSVLLDVSDPIKDPYILEVSSPGLERPLVKPRDYQRYCGQKVVVSTLTPIEGRKRFLGQLVSANEDELTLDLEQALEGESPHVMIPFANVRAAHLHVDFEKHKN
jgi:ribosome maturation factor RimP